MVSEFTINCDDNNNLFIYLFIVEKFRIYGALFDQSLNKYLHLKMNSLLGSKIRYSVTICINFI
jgi:hypothetical protein